MVGVATGGKGRRGKKGSVVGNGTSVGVTTVGSVVQHVGHVGVSLIHSPSGVGLRPPRHIVNGVEVYGWEEHKMNEPNREEDVPPPVQEHGQPEESSSSLMRRTVSVLKRCVVS